MNTQFDLRGASGAVYRYRVDNPARPANAAGGIFVYVRQTEEAVEVLYAGETDSLARADFDQWQRAVAEFGPLGSGSAAEERGQTRGQQPRTGA